MTYHQDVNRMMFYFTGEAGSSLKDGPEPQPPSVCRRGCRGRGLSFRLHYRRKKAEKPDEAGTCSSWEIPVVYTA